MYYQVGEEAGNNVWFDVMDRILNVGFVKWRRIIKKNSSSLKENSPTEFPMGPK